MIFMEKPIRLEVRVVKRNRKEKMNATEDFLEISEILELNTNLGENDSFTPKVLEFSLKYDGTKQEAKEYVDEKLKHTPYQLKSIQ